jgi:hypothetical protein
MIEAPPDPARQYPARAGSAFPKEGHPMTMTDAEMKAVIAKWAFTLEEVIAIRADIAGGMAMIGPPWGQEFDLDEITARFPAFLSHNDCEQSSCPVTNDDAFEKLRVDTVARRLLATVGFTEPE